MKKILTIAAVIAVLAYGTRNNTHAEDAQLPQPNVGKVVSLDYNQQDLMLQCRSVTARQLDYTSGYSVKADDLCGCLVDSQVTWATEGHMPTVQDQASAVLICNEMAQQREAGRSSVN